MWSLISIVYAFTLVVMSMCYNVYVMPEID